MSATATDAAFLTIEAAAPLIAAGRLSPVELTTAVLDRIAAADALAPAYTTVLRESALEEAQRAEADIAAGKYRGRLHGIPVGVKGIIDIAGLVTHAGSRAWSPEPAAADAEVVRRLRAAGAVLLGAHHLYEFAMGGTAANPHFGTLPNPWDAGRIPGGSSSGSAVAVAAGLATAALGTDANGSIREPAAFCGVTGVKPTFGLVSRRGSIEMSPSTEHIGPLTRSAYDAAAVLEAVAGHDPADPHSLTVPAPDLTATIRAGIRGRRIGLPDDIFFEDLHPDVAAAIDRARAVLTDLGASFHHVQMPWAGVADEVCGRLTRIESASFFMRHLSLPDVAAKLGGLLRSRFAEGISPPGADLHEISVLRAGMRRAGEVAFNGIDLLLTPSTRRTAGPMPLGHPLDDGGAKFTRVFAFTGQPSMTIPAGFDGDGLPIGIALTARRRREDLLFRAGYAFQQATDHHDGLRPPFL